MTTSVVISGSRGWADQSVVNKTIEAIPPDWTIICGGARGVDSWAEARARGLNCTVIRIDADWNLHEGCKCKDTSVGSVCKFAGYRRNIEMLETARALGKCMVIAFWDGESPGTRHCMDTARKMGIPVKVIAGKSVSQAVLDHEQHERTEQRSGAEWRTDEAALREGFESWVEEPRTEGVAPEVIDSYLDFMEVERSKWPDPLHKDRYFDRRLPNPFSDTDELVNLEDFTMEELAIIDHVCEKGRNERRLAWRIAHEVPLSGPFLEEIWEQAALLVA